LLAVEQLLSLVEWPADPKVAQSASPFFTVARRAVTTFTPELIQGRVHLVAGQHGRDAQTLLHAFCDVDLNAGACVHCAPEFAVCIVLVVGYHLAPH
jgi:hypothetical protein